MRDDAGRKVGFKSRRGDTKGWERFARTSDQNSQLLAQAANEMERVYYSHNDRVAHKWHDYLAAYGHATSRFRGTHANSFEIGVHHGGSLHIWESYLGVDATIDGIDILKTRKYIFRTA